MHNNIAKPVAGQHSDWAPVYIKHVPDDGMVLDHLEKGLQQMIAFVEPLTEEQLLYRYAEGKWSIKEVLVHLMDVERVFSYRALCAAREDRTNLPGFDHNAYVPHSGADNRTKNSLLDEYRTLRASTLAFFNGLEEEALFRVGMASGQPCTASAMVHMITGHEQHHLGILKERYLQKN
jgi:uncharacterized damage-inducible protein DinB